VSLPSPTLTCIWTAPAGAGGSGAGGLTNFDAAGNQLPSGITRPVPQHLGGTTAALLSEMAGQLGRLTALVREVEGLKEENTALKRSMEVLTQVYSGVRVYGTGGEFGGGVGAGGLQSGPCGITEDGGDAAAGIEEAGAGGSGGSAGGGDSGMAVEGAASGGSEGAAGGSSGSGSGPAANVRDTGAGPAAAAAAVTTAAAGGKPPLNSIIPLSQAVEVQQKRLWDQKLRHDDLEKQVGCWLVSWSMRRKQNGKGKDRERRRRADKPMGNVRRPGAGPVRQVATGRSMPARPTPYAMR
jgi:hypothetical protein